MPIRLLYGSQQRFRLRYRDLNVIGNVDTPMPLRRSVYRLNNGPEHAFYVEQVDQPDVDWRFAYKNSPARLRLKDPGDFNLEIPIDAPELKSGANRLEIRVEDGRNRLERLEAELSWDPAPVALPLDLTDLARFSRIQEVGQVVNGAFDLDPAGNAIRSQAPVRPDALLILAAPHASQEATYGVRFSDLEGAKYLGLSDFFVGHEENDPPLGIKPGWSTAGLATLTSGWRPGSPAEVGLRPAAEGATARPDGEARVWLASGDNARRAGRWLVRTDPPARVPIAAGVTYRVRHQVRFEGGTNRARFRLWPADEPEPERWLCDEDDSGVERGLARFSRASFALFQHTGSATEWTDPRVVPL